VPIEWDQPNIYIWIIKIGDNEPDVGQTEKSVSFWFLGRTNTLMIEVQKWNSVILSRSLRYKHLHLIKQRLLTVFVFAFVRF